MTFFPYGFSKEEVYEKLCNVEDLIYVAIFLLPLFFTCLIVKLTHAGAFWKAEGNEAQSSLSPLLTKSARTSSRMMTLIHVIFFLNGISHIFHVGWLVDILWYPMWIAAWTIKIYTETYLLVISLFSISRYFVHFSLVEPSVELTSSAVNSGIRWIYALMFFKDCILFIWLLVVVEMGLWDIVGRILDYFYGFYVSYQLVLFLATLMLVLVICSSKRAEVKPSHLEKMIYLQTIGVGVLKMILTAILLGLLIAGINDTVLSFLFVTSDAFLVAIVTQFSEIWYKPKRVECQANQEPRIGMPPTEIEMAEIDR